MMRTSGISSCGDDPDSGISAISPANDSVSMDGLAGFTSPKIPLSFDARRVFLVGVAQLVRAPDCGSGGRRFDSGRSPLFLLPRHSRWLANFCDTTLGIGGASAPPKKARFTVLTPLRTLFIVQFWRRAAALLRFAALCSRGRCVLRVFDLFRGEPKLFEN